MFDLLLYSFYGTKGAEWLGWQGIAAIASIGAILVHLSLMMFGRSFSIRELEVYSKSEILQALATVVMVIALVSLVDGVQGYVTSSGMLYGKVNCKGLSSDLKQFTGTTTIGGGKEPFKDVLDYVRCKIQEKSVQVAKVQDRSMEDAWAAYFQLNMAFSVFGITVFKGDWVTDWYQDAEKMRITNDLATRLLIALNAQSFLVQYIKNNMLHFFLPVGLLLRSFHFTRGAGALMISLGIGLYFIFPVIYLLTDPGFVKLELPKKKGMTTSMAKTACYPSMSAAVAIITTTPAASTVASVVSSKSLSDQLSESYVSLMVHPLVSLFLSLAFIRYMMVLLGGDTYDMMKMFTKVI